MKKLMTFAMIATFLLVPVALFAGDEGSWTGEVLDMKCYGDGQKGAGHAGCAARCLGGGSDMGLLVDGEVVKVDRAESDADAIKTLEKLGGKAATVTGTAMEADGATVVKVTAAKAA